MRVVVLWLLLSTVLLLTLLILLPAWLHGRTLPLVALRSVPPLETDRIDYVFYESLRMNPLLHLRLALKGKPVKGMWMIAYRSNEHDFEAGRRNLERVILSGEFGLVMPDPEGKQSTEYQLTDEDTEITVRMPDPSEAVGQNGQRLIFLQVVQF